MIQKKSAKLRGLLLAGLLVTGFAAVGVTYARWAERVQIKSGLRTGAMEVVFAQERPFGLSLVDAPGRTLGRTDGLEVTFPDEKTAVISARGSLAASELMEAGYLKLEYPLEKGVSGSVDGIELLRADFEKTSEERVELRPSRAELVLDGQVYSLPGEDLAAFEQPLYFSVYRQVEEADGAALAAVYLALTEESRERLGALETELELDGEALSSDLLAAAGADVQDGGTVSVPVEIRVEYVCSIPLHVEQGHTDILQFS